MRWLAGVLFVLACHDARMSQLDQVRALRRPIAFDDVARVLGLPVRDLGSGIHIYEYQLDNGGTLRVGTPDNQRVLYIQLVDATGGASDIYRE